MTARAPDDGIQARQGGLGPTEYTVLGKALGHRLRVRIAVALAELEEAGPKGLSVYLGESLQNVAYHVRYLVDLDMLELVRTEAHRGAIGHIYRLKPSLRAAVGDARSDLPAPTDPQSTAARHPFAAFVTDAAPRPGAAKTTFAALVSHADLERILVDHPEAVCRFGKALSDPRRVAILGHLFSGPPRTTAEIAHAVGMKTETIRSRMLTLQKGGLVVRHDEPHLRHRWAITDRGAEALAGSHRLLSTLRTESGAAA